MIFGEDPHEQVNHRPQSQTMKETTELFDHFQFMSRRSGFRPVEVIDSRIFKSQLNRILNKGVPKRALRDSINVFFSTQQGGGNSRSLWKVFLTTKVLDDLIKAVEVVPEVDSTVLAWMLHDFNRTEDLPWDPVEDRRIRNIVLSHTEVLHRYPYFVTEMLETRPLDEVKEILSRMEVLIREVVLASRRTARVVSDLREMGVTLPPGITTNRTLKRCAPTLAHAVFNDQPR